MRSRSSERSRKAMVILRRGRLPVPPEFRNHPRFNGTHAVTKGSLKMSLEIDTIKDTHDADDVRRAWLHADNIGRIALALADHEAGDWGDCAINDPIVSIIDRMEPA